MTLTIFGAPRTKGNTPDLIIRGRRIIRLPSKPYRKWYRLATQQVPLLRAAAREQGVALPIAVRANVAAIFFRERGGRADLDNYEKGLGDFLQRARIVENDHLLTWDGSRVEVDRERPRIELVITERA